MLTVIKEKTAEAVTIFIYSYRTSLALLLDPYLLQMETCYLRLTDPLNSQIRVNSSGKGTNQDK